MSPADFLGILGRAPQLLGWPAVGCFLLGLGLELGLLAYVHCLGEREARIRAAIYETLVGRRTPR